MGYLRVQNNKLYEVDREIFFDAYNGLDLTKRKITNNSFRLGRIMGTTAMGSVTKTVNQLLSSTFNLTNSIKDTSVTPYIYTCPSGKDVYSMYNTNSSHKYLFIIDAISLGDGIPSWGFPSESLHVKQLHVGRNWWIESGGGSYIDNKTSTNEVITNLQLFDLTNMLNDGVIPSIPSTYDEFLLMTGMIDDYYPYGNNSIQIPVKTNFIPSSIAFDSDSFSLSEYMTYFPNGLHGDGKYYDEINFTTGKVIKRFDDTGEVLDTPVIYNTEPVTTDRIANSIIINSTAGIGILSIICEEEWG